MEAKKKAVILSSGGLDSTTVMAIAKAENFEIYSLSFHYGQRHICELECAKHIAKLMGAKQHLVVNSDFTEIGGSALTTEMEVPKGRDISAVGAEIPVTYVPARNTIFLSYALGWAEVLGSEDIFIGVNAVDYSGYPDCRPEYIAAFTKMANLATKVGVEGKQKLTIHTPLISLSKAQIIQKGTELGVDYGITLSCYDPTPQGEACGQCDSCQLRRNGFAEAGILDPTRYKAR